MFVRSQRHSRIRESVENLAKLLVNNYCSAGLFAPLPHIANVVDPPRMGCDAVCERQLLAFRAQMVVY